MTVARGPAELRAARDDLVRDSTRRGAAFGQALAALVDAALLEALADHADEPVALVALGSYARRELCPASDLDVLLLHDGGTDVAALADACWYPLWDAGFVLGHATRTVKETRKLASSDLDTLTGLLDARIVGGPLGDAAQGLLAEAHRLARRRGSGLVTELADAATLRRVRPGLVAEMLEPNLKDGAGGLRDVQALRWAGWALADAGGLGALAAVDAIHPDDVGLLEDANEVLLDVRVALHRVSGGRSDVLALQDQDAVAAVLGYGDADDLIRVLARASRRVAWVADDAWSRLRDRRARRRAGEERLGTGMLVRDGRLVLDPAAELRADGSSVLRIARTSIDAGVPIDRSALAALRDGAPVAWSPTAREDLLRVLGSGRRLIDVGEALDHENLLRLVLPEWERVRWLPQRNAYHRFTVDRHLLETVAEAGELLVGAEPREARVVDGLRRPEVLLLGALLHDIAKGSRGDHAVLGAATACEVGQRIGLDEEEIADLQWLVRRHLLMADTATRRDLAEPVTVERFGAEVRTEERLRLLTLLTVADSRATGPAAWGSAKAALVAELYDRTLAWLSGQGVEEPAAEEGLAAALAGPGVVVSWEPMDGGRWRAAVGAPDRPGLLADVAGALSLEGFDILSATAHSRSDGRAAEVFVGTDTFGRLGDEAGRARAAATVTGVLDGSVALEAGLAARRQAYHQVGDRRGAADELRIRIVQDASADASVVEVFARDEIGLLATVARVFADLGFDVTVAKVATTGELAVDVFYVQDQRHKITTAARAGELERTLRAAVQRG